jgi:hypothetical protein
MPGAGAARTLSSDPAYVSLWTTGTARETAKTGTTLTKKSKARNNQTTKILLRMVEPPRKKDFVVFAPLAYHNCCLETIEFSRKTVRINLTTGPVSISW